MSISVLPYVAVPAAVAGAASFGVASALQQRATKEVPDAGVLGPQLLVELAHRPRWLLASAAVGLGLALQLVALAFAPLTLVQPILVSGIVFGTLAAAWLAHRRPDRTVVLGAVCASAGLGAFLALARPDGGTGQLPPLPVMAPLALVLAGVVAACFVVAVRTDGPARVGALALATGVCYGVTAGLMKIVTAELRTGGPLSVLTHAPLYVVCVVGPLGFLLSQHTFQQGTLIAPALAVITVVDPLVGILIGLSWLGEHVSDTSSLDLAGEAVAGVVLVAGVVVLAHRGTQLRARIAAEGSA
jgi:drug/metabolite transporter (DMT)-like permease